MQGTNTHREALEQGSMMQGISVAGYQHTERTPEQGSVMQGISVEELQ